MWGWAILAFVLGFVASWAYDNSNVHEAITLGAVGRARIVLGTIVGIILFLLILAALIETDWLPRWGWRFYSIMVAPRFAASIAGVASGIAVQRLLPLVQVPELPDWATTSAIAVLLLAAVVFAFNPRLLDSLQSFKAAGVEATFATRSSSVREAEIHLNDVAQKLTLGEYDHFRDHVVDLTSPRRKIGLWYTPELETMERVTVLSDVLENFANPIVVALICLNEKDALEAAKRQDNLVRIASAWEHFLLGLNKPKDEKAEERDWKAFSSEISEQTRKFFDYVRQAGAGCENGNEFKPSFSEGLDRKIELVKDDYRRSLKSLPTSARDLPLAVTAMEPYVAGLVGDLIALVFGQAEKAEFLDQVTQGLPTNRLVSPGTINLLFQIADAKIQSEVSWPLDSLTNDLDNALQGSDGFITRAIQQRQENPQDSAIAKKIIQTYDVVVFRILTENLALYNQRILRSEPLSEAHLRRWTSILSRILAISHAYTKTLGPVEDIPLLSLSSAEIERWPSVGIADKFLIDANIGIALSLVLRDPSQEQSTAAACASARYYLKNAEGNLAKLYNDGKDGEINYSEKERLEQYIRLVGYRVGAHCTARL